ncbi:MAG: 23S rRNA (adenine(2503)-C(2))-methyltransferase RlmN [Planctomycetota bacterium]
MVAKAPDFLGEARPGVFGASLDELKSAFASAGQPAFRAKQIRKWVFDRHVAEPEEMTDLPRGLRERLGDVVDLSKGEIVADQVSSDGTHKLLIAWPDGAEAECVMIPDGDRRTACVSSQVGCPVGCRFCASGVAGLKQNLTAGRILEQVWHLNRAMRSRGDRVGRVTNLVFMGMGEPLSNYGPVLSATRRLHDDDGFGMGWRRITLSTVGVPKRMRQLADEQVPINLALSLHAPEEHLRREIIPWADHFELGDILDACRHYFEATGREVTFEYILLAGVNDEPHHAKRLAAICRNGGFKVNVNLLRYNEVEGLPYRRPSGDRVMRFQQLLRDQNVNAHVRKSRGRDIDAACGQLRRKKTAADVPELVQLESA